MIEEIAAAHEAPPATHPVTGATPLATAAANASHPAYPQPPQLPPESNSRIAATFGSTSTANIFLKSPRSIPNRNPITRATIIV